MMTVRKVQEGTGHPAEGATHILAPRNRGWPLSTREPWVATFDHPPSGTNGRRAIPFAQGLQTCLPDAHHAEGLFSRCRIGILAKNGGNKEASELDANFEFFELHAPVPERTSGWAK